MEQNPRLDTSIDMMTRQGAAPSVISMARSNPTPLQGAIDQAAAEFI